MFTPTEAYMVKVIAKNRNMMIPYYIMCCYSYYRANHPLVRDRFFDRLALALSREFNYLDHYHKKFLTEEEVKAATFKGEYPSIMPSAVHSMRFRHVYPNGGLH